MVPPVPPTSSFPGWISHSPWSAWHSNTFNGATARCPWVRGFPGPHTAPTTFGRRHLKDVQTETFKWLNLGYMAVCQNLVPLVNIKIAGKWMFIPLKNGINRYWSIPIYIYIQTLQPLGFDVFFKKTSFMSSCRRRCRHRLSSVPQYNKGGLLKRSHAWATSCSWWGDPFTIMLINGLV